MKDMTSNRPLSIVIFETINYLSILILIVSSMSDILIFSVTIIFAWIYIFQLILVYFISRKKSNVCSYIYVIISILIIIGSLITLNTDINRHKFPDYLYLLVITSSCFLLCFEGSIKWLSNKNFNINFSFNGPRDLEDDSYVYYLTKKYDVEKVETLNKFIYQGIIFQDSQSVLEYVHDIECRSNRKFKKTKTQILIPYLIFFIVIVAIGFSLHSLDGGSSFGRLGKLFMKDVKVPVAPVNFQSTENSSSSTSNRDLKYEIQVGVFSSLERLNYWIKKINQHNLPNYVLEKSSSEEVKLYVLRVGPFMDLLNAKSAETILRDLGLTPRLVEVSD